MPQEFPWWDQSDLLILTSQLAFPYLLVSRENSQLKSNGPGSLWDSESNHPLSLFYRWEKLRPRKKHEVLQMHSEGDRGLKLSNKGSGLDAHVQIPALLHVSCAALGPLPNPYARLPHL